MAQRSSVPKFGNWEGEENVPYTVYFDKARKKRTTGAKLINPNDPQENPDMFPAPVSPPAPAPAARREPAEPVVGRRAVRPTHERRLSKEDSDPIQYTAPSARTGGQERRGGGRGGGAYGPGSGRPVRNSAGSDHSIDKSPLHPQYKVGGRGGASPAPEGKNSYDSSHGTPGRSRVKPNRGDESPDKGAAVPRFGEWDENNPSAGENYTHIFNKVREEKHSHGSPQISMDHDSSYNNVRQGGSGGNHKAKCFSCSIM